MAAARQVSLRQGAPEFDLFIAKATLETGGDLAHGAQHLAELLLLDPTRPEWLALVDRYVSAAHPGIDALVPETGSPYAATEALRAYLWQRQGRTDDAIAKLIDVARALGHARYLNAWVLEWLEPAGAVESLSESTCQRMLGSMLTLSEEAHIASFRTLRCLGRWADLAERVGPLHAPTGLWTMIRAGLLRKAGRFDAALAVAGPIDQAQDFNQAAAIGLALRRKGRFEASVRAFEKGLELQPGVVAGHLEAGDSLVEGGDWAKALRAYETALTLEPGQPWAEPSAWYCRWKLEGEQAWIERLFDAAKAGNRRAHELWFLERGAIDESGDASANVLRQVVAAWKGKAPDDREAPSKTTLSTLEAPSNRLAFALEMQAFGVGSQMEVLVSSVPAVDPRTPVRPVKYLLWRYEGMDPQPALAAGPAEVSARIAALAAQRYDPHANWAQASHVAAALGAQGVVDVLAVMVHPPALPDGVRALAWLPRLHLAAAFVLAQIDGGWEASVRREALLSLLFGPWDWTTVAGIRAMAWIARVEPAHAMDIHAAFEQMEKHLPSEGHWDWERVLYNEWETIPYLFDNERAALRAKLEALTD